MGESKAGPDIRFAGFTDAWEQRKLSDYLETSNEKNILDEYSKEDVLSVSGDVGIVNQIEFKGRSFAGVSVSNYGVVHTGDIVYTKSPLQLNPFGIIKVNKGRSGIVSTLYAVYHPRNNVYSSFIQTYFEQHARVNSYLHPLVNKGAKNDMKVSADNALKGLVSFPKVEEQKQISRFFALLDRLITLHQREYEKTLNIKKAMLEKMFPKEGSDRPEIRFAGFTDAWEQRKTSEIFRAVSDKGYPELPVLSATQDRGMILREETGISIAHDKKNEGSYKRVLPGQFVIHLRSFQGGFAHSGIEGITSPAYTVFAFKEWERHCDWFWKHIFTTDAFIKRLESVTYGIRDGRSISYADFSELTFLFPSISEQKHIGEFSMRLDNLITLHQRELKKLQNMKKALLEKMFV